MTKPAEYSKSGQPIYRYEDKEDRQWRAPSFGEEGWSEQIEEHVEKYFGTVDSVFHEVVSDLIHVDVHHIKPTPERNFHTLFTTGMSYLPMNSPEGLTGYDYAELLICLPPDWPVSQEASQNEEHYWPIRWLKTLARFPHEYDSWLATAHTIPCGNPPEPLSARTRMNGFILLPPVTVSSEFAALTMKDGRIVRFYCLVPLYEEEMSFKLKHGTDALFKKLDEVGVNEIVNLQRKNACKSSWFQFWRR